MRTRIETSQQKLGWSPPTGFVRDFECRLFDAIRRDLQAVLGIREALNRVRKPWCVVSNGRPDDIRFRLGLGGLIEDFEPHLFSAIEVACDSDCSNSTGGR